MVRRQLNDGALSLYRLRAEVNLARLGKLRLALIAEELVGSFLGLGFALVQAGADRGEQVFTRLADVGVGVEQAALEDVGAVAQGTGTLATPLGAKLLRTSAMPAGKIIGLDKNYALERICGSEVLVEYDKLIDRQLERAAITSISGFAKPYQEASKVLSLQ